MGWRDRSMREWAFRLGTRLHRAVFDLTRGRLLGRLGGMDVVRLTTTGRDSGRPHTVMLTAPTRTRDGEVVLVASYGGDDRHPAWYRNLREHPEVELTVAGERFRATARTATAAERAELWPQIVSAYGGYAAYQRRADREVPVVICERHRQPTP